MKKKEESQGLIKKDEKNLAGELEKKRKELQKVTFDVATREAKNTADIQKIKKSIARILTVLREKEILKNKKQ